MGRRHTRRRGGYKPSIAAVRGGYKPSIAAVRGGSSDIFTALGNGISHLMRGGGTRRRKRRGGFLGKLIVPLGLLGMQQTYRRGRTRRHKHKR